MTLAAAAILIIVWPGHDIPPDHYPSRAVCEQTLDMLRHAGHDLFETVPGFRAWCEPDGPALMS
jgi:hypothetical protein